MKIDKIDTNFSREDLKLRERKQRYSIPCNGFDL